MDAKNYDVIFAKEIKVKANSKQEAKIKAISRLIDHGNIGINDIIKIKKTGRKIILV